MNRRQYLKLMAQIGLIVSMPAKAKEVITCSSPITPSVIAKEALKLLEKDLMRGEYILRKYGV